MAVEIKQDYDHVDFVEGTNVSRHMFKDTEARNEVEEVKQEVSDLKSAFDEKQTETDTLLQSTLFFLPGSLKTNIITINTAKNKRGHSPLFRTSEAIEIIVTGIPDGYELVIYECGTKDQSISGRSHKIQNGVAFSVSAGRYYRFVIHDSDVTDAYEIDTILYSVHSVGTSAGAYDIIMFAGQSNMAGRGISTSEHPETAPTAVEGCGYEYRAISDPTKLYQIGEPFGYAENKSGGLNDGTYKTGSAVTAFVNAYYKNGGAPVIAVSASEGGTNLLEWVTGYESNTGRLYDACERLRSCISYCESNRLAIRHVFVVWCQGETDAKYIYDGRDGFTMATYVERFETCQQAFLNAGAEKVLVIRIGKRGPNPAEPGNLTYNAVIEKQTELAQTDTDLVMICADLAGLRARGLMKDESHYYQVAYNEFGTYAGINAAVYASTSKEPTMYDPYYDNLYYSKKN